MIFKKNTEKFHRESNLLTVTSTNFLVFLIAITLMVAMLIGYIIHAFFGESILKPSLDLLENKNTEGEHRDYEYYNNSSYSLNKKENKIFFCEPFDMTCIMQEVKNANPDTFEVLPNFWARDINTLYYYGQEIPNIDPSTVIFINTMYVKDKNNIYSPDLEATRSPFSRAYTTYKKISPPLNAATFSVLNNPPSNRFDSGMHYVKDKHKVYFYFYGEFQEILSVDAPSFEKIGYGYFKDNNKVYYEYIINSGLERKIEMKAIADADPETFQPIPDAPHDDYMKFDPGERLWKNLALGKDKNNFFVKNKKRVGVDSESFVVLVNHYAKDKNFVYFTGDNDLVILNGADPDTFKVIGCHFESCGEDYNGKWQRSDRVRVKFLPSRQSIRSNIP